MARMIRKQIYIEPRQDAILKRQAAELGVSEAELIRRWIATEGQAVGTASFPTRPEAAEEEMRFIKERASRLQDLKKKRGWTRDELYEERLGRFSR